MSSIDVNYLLDFLQWEVFPSREPFPICPTNRHQRYRYPEVFGPKDDLIDPLGGDVMLRDNRKYAIAYEFHGEWKDIIKWSIVENK